MSPQQLRAVLDAILTPALDGLAADVGDDPQRRLALTRLTAGRAVEAADRELRALGSRDRARVVAELAMSAALLHHKLAELGHTSPSGQDLQALTVPVSPRKV